MKTRILLGGVAALLILGMAGAAFWWWRPQIITMSNGSKLTLLAVEYGRKHTPPNVKTSGGTASGRHGGAFTTTNDTLVVWVRQEYDHEQNHYFQFFAYDLANTACIGAGFSPMGNRQGSEVLGLRLDGFPRRQGRFLLRVQENSNTGQEWSDQKFIIRNPVRGPFAGWTPAPLPNTQEDEDVAVTLAKLVTGAALPFQRNNGEDDAKNKGVQATFQVTRNGQSVTNWEPVAVETSDATGNHVAGDVTGNQWNGGDDAATYQPGLWPDEPAWKLRFEFSQQADFADTELWSVAAIPMQPGRQQDFWNFNNRPGSAANAAVADTDVNGFHLTVFPVKHFTDTPPNSLPQGGLTIQVTPELPEGMRLTLVTLTDDQTNDIGNWNCGTLGDGKGTTYHYGLRDLSGVTNLNLTLALHRSRFVEFTVKPETAPAVAHPERKI